MSFRTTPYNIDGMKPEEARCMECGKPTNGSAVYSPVRVDERHRLYLFCPGESSRSSSCASTYVKDNGPRLLESELKAAPVDEIFAHVKEASKTEAGSGVHISL